MAAITGAAIARKAIRPAPAVSAVPTTELPNPPVVAVEAARSPAKPELIVADVPPPAINPNAHCGKVPSSANWLANKTDPATVAMGTDTVSSR